MIMGSNELLKMFPSLILLTLHVVASSAQTTNSIAEEPFVRYRGLMDRHV